MTGFKTQTKRVLPVVVVGVAVAALGGEPCSILLSGSQSSSSETSDTTSSVPSTFSATVGAASSSGLLWVCYPLREVDLISCTENNDDGGQ